MINGTIEQQNELISRNLSQLMMARGTSSEEGTICKERRKLHLSSDYLHSKVSGYLLGVGQLHHLRSREIYGKGAFGPRR